MSDKDFQTISETEKNFHAARDIAEDPSVEFDALAKSMGIQVDAPPEARIPQQAEPGRDAANDAFSGITDIFSKPKPAAGQSESDLVQQGIDGVQKSAQGELKGRVQNVGGALDVVSNVMNAVPDVINGLEEFMYKKGYTKADFMGFENNGATFDVADAMGVPSAVTEADKTARSTGRFLTQFSGFLAAGVGGAAAATAAGLSGAATTATSMAASGVANFALFDPHDEKFSNFLKDNVGMRNVVVDYLASDPRDSRVEGRFKAALEGILGDAAIAGAFAAYAGGVRFARALKGKKVFNAGAPVVTEAAEAGGETLATKIGAETVENADEAADAARSVEPLDGELQTQKAAAEIEGEQANMAAAEMNNADGAATQAAEAPSLVQETASKGKPSAVRATTDMKQMAYDKVLDVPPQTPEELEELLKHFNVERRTSDDFSRALLGDNIEGVVDAAGTPQTWGSLSKEAFEEFKNPAKLLAFRPGDKELSRATNIAVNMHLALTEGAMLQARKELKEMLTPGVMATEAARTQAAANLNRLSEQFIAWAGVSKGVGADFSRGLASRAMMSDDTAAMLDKMILAQDTLATTTGTVEDALIQAENLVKVLEPDVVKHYGGEKGLFGKLADFAQSGKIGRGVQQLYINFMLSGTGTHKMNMLGNAINNIEKSLILSNAAWLKYIPGVAKEAKISTTMLREAFPGMALTPAEALSTGLPLVSAAQKEAFKFSKNAQPLLEESGIYLTELIANGKSELFTMRYLTKEGQFGIMNTKFGESMKLLSKAELEALGPAAKAAYFASHIKTPLNALQTSDAFMGAVAMRSEQHLMALRQAENIAAPGTAEYKEAFDTFMQNPPMWAQKQLLENKDRLLLTTPLEGFAKSFEDMLRKIPILKYTAAPFTKVAANGTFEAIARTPGAASVFSSRTRKAMAAGGRERTIAISQQVTGAQFALVASAFAAQGMLTGGEPTTQAGRDAWKREGKTPYTFTGPDGTKVSIAKLEVVGNIMKVVADLHQLSAYAEENDVAFDDLAAVGVTLAVDYISPDYMFDGMGRFTDAMVDPNKFKKYLEQLATNATTPNLMRDMVKGNVGSVDTTSADSMINTVDNALALPVIGAGAGAGIAGLPGMLGGAALGVGATLFADASSDGIMRVTKESNAASFWDNLVVKWKSGIPGLSKDLPMQHNLWGDPVTFSDGMGPANMSPTFGPGGDNSINLEISRLGLQGPIFKRNRTDGQTNLSIELPVSSYNDGGVNINLNAEQHQALIQLAAGRLEPMVKMGLVSAAEAKEARKVDLASSMSAFMKSDEYKGLSDEDKRSEIKAMVREFRDQGRRLLKQTYPELGLDSAEGQLKRLSQSTGVTSQDVEPGLREVRQQRTEIQKSRGAGKKGAPSL